MQVRLTEPSCFFGGHAGGKRASVCNPRREPICAVCLTFSVILKPDSLCRQSPLCLYFHGEYNVVLPWARALSHLAPAAEQNKKRKWVFTRSHIVSTGDFVSCFKCRTDKNTDIDMFEWRLVSTNKLHLVLVFLWKLLGMFQFCFYRVSLLWGASSAFNTGRLCLACETSVMQHTILLQTLRILLWKIVLPLLVFFVIHLNSFIMSCCYRYAKNNSIRTMVSCFEVCTVPTGCSFF